MKQFRVLKRSFINGSLREPGAIVDYAGKPGSNLEEVSAREIKADAKAAEKAAAEEVARAEAEARTKAEAEAKAKAEKEVAEKAAAEAAKKA